MTMPMHPSKMHHSSISQRSASPAARTSAAKKKWTEKLEWPRTPSLRPRNASLNLSRHGRRFFSGGRSEPDGCCTEENEVERAIRSTCHSASFIAVRMEKPRHSIGSEKDRENLNLIRTRIDPGFRRQNHNSHDGRLLCRDLAKLAWVRWIPARFRPINA